MEDTILTIRNMLRTNWTLASPLQYPVAGDKRTGVPIETVMTEAVRPLHYPTVEVKNNSKTSKPLSSNWWQVDHWVDVHIWARAQTFNNDDIEAAKADRNKMRDEVERIIHVNDTNTLKNDAGAFISSYLWLEGSVPKDMIDKEEGVEYPVIHEITTFHARYVHGK